MQNSFLYGIASKPKQLRYITHGVHQKAGICIDIGQIKIEHQANKGGKRKEDLKCATLWYGEI